MTKVNSVKITIFTFAHSSLIKCYLSSLQLPRILGLVHLRDDFTQKKDIFIIMNILFSNKVINAFFYQSDESSST